ncbi:MAG: hypothetical protein AAFW75_10660 [Cyanobacteria bacterium J06636_16]
MANVVVIGAQWGDEGKGLFLGCLGSSTVLPSDRIRTPIVKPFGKELLK